MARDLIVDRLRRRAREQPARVALWTPRAGTWEPWTWSEYHTRVRAFAAALIAAGHRPGEVVAILGANRPEWTTSVLGAHYAGGVAAGVYTTSSPEEIAYVVQHAEAVCLVVEHARRWREQVAPVIDRLTGVRTLVLMEAGETVDDPRVIPFDRFLARGEAADHAIVDRRFDALSPTSLATLIYTSGTTGPPKGVMLSHHNIAWTAQAARELVGGHERDRMVSYLPLAHIAEQDFSIYGHVSFGMELFFCPQLERLPEVLTEVQPTLFFGVPRVWEKIQARLERAFAEAGGPKARLIAWARETAGRYWARRDGGLPVGPWLETQMRLARALVFDKLKPRLGFGALRLGASGAAPLAREAIAFFRSIDVPIYEVYGQSEDCGPTSFNPPGAVRLGTVGLPLAGLEVKIADDGEILVRGPNVFMGYYKDEQASREALRDGWLHSGDIGAFDEAGYLKITDRKKEIIITSGGKNVSPQWIENRLKQTIEPVSQAVVIGDRRKYISALLALDPAYVRRVCDEHGLRADDPRSWRDQPAVRAEIERGIAAVNATLARVEQIKAWRLLPRELTIEAGELTPTMKLKRRVIERNHAALIASMYEEQSAPAAR